MLKITSPADMLELWCSLLKIFENSSQGLSCSLWLQFVVYTLGLRKLPFLDSNAIHYSSRHVPCFPAPFHGYDRIGLRIGIDTAKKKSQRSKLKKVKSRESRRFLEVKGKKKSSQESQEGGKRPWGQRSKKVKSRESRRRAKGFEVKGQKGQVKRVWTRTCVNADRCERGQVWNESFLGFAGLF
jgi:hypothetical protein